MRTRRAGLPTWTNQLLRGLVSGAVILGAAPGLWTASASDNTWTVLSPTPGTRWKGTVNGGTYTCAQPVVQGNPIGRSYSGGAIGNGPIMHWGGAHGSYPGNDVELYDTLLGV